MADKLSLIIDINRRISELSKEAADLQSTIAKDFQLQPPDAIDEVGALIMELLRKKEYARAKKVLATFTRKGLVEDKKSEYQQQVEAFSAYLKEKWEKRDRKEAEKWWNKINNVNKSNADK